MRRAGAVAAVAILAWGAPAVASAGVVASPQTTPARADAIAACDRLVESRPDDYSSFHCYLSAARRERRFEEARKKLEAHLALHPGNTLARVVLARILSDLEDPRAEQLFRRSAAEFAEKAMPVGEVFARCDLAFFLRRRGRLAEAATEVTRARAAAEAAQIPFLRVAVDSEEGWIAYGRADYDRAELLFRGAWERARKASWALQAPILSGLGATFWATGRDRESYDIYLRLAEGHRRQSDPYTEADELYNASLLADRLEADGAIGAGQAAALLKRALETALAAGNQQAETALRLSRAGDRRLPLAERLAEAEKALAIARRSGDEERISDALRELARLHLEGDPVSGARARALAQEALARARAQGNLPGIARGRIRLAEVLLATGPAETARAEALAALDAIERIRDLQSDDLVQARFASEWAFYYYRVSGRMLRSAAGDSGPEEIDRAFRIMERLRARVLLDRLDAAGATEAAETTATGRLASESERLRAERGEILGQIASLRSRLSGPENAGPLRRTGIATLDRLEADEAALREAIARMDPRFAHLRHAEPPGLAEVQAALGPDEAMITYQLSTGRIDPEYRVEDDGGSWLFVITSETVGVEPLADEDAVEERAGIFLGLLGRRDGSETEGAVRLYRNLLTPALRHLPAAKRRIVLVPDRSLFRLPFEALREAPGALPMGVRYEMALAPSAALWLRWRRSPPAEGAVPVLVLANPGLSRPREEGGTERVSDRAGRAWVARPLPYARHEAHAVSRALGGGGEVLIGSQATGRVLAAADWTRYRILHIAAHALVDEERPDRTAILLSPLPPDDDGRVGINRVAALHLRGQVVVLSACRSSSGLLLRGEGVVGLARAFFQAGARAVLGSLWRIRDDEASEMVKEFYDRLGRGRSLGDALRGARAARFASGAPAAAWAGFVLIGDAATVPIPGGRPAPPWMPAVILGIAAVAAVAAGLALRRVLRRRSAAGAHMGAPGP